MMILRLARSAKRPSGMPSKQKNSAKARPSSRLIWKSLTPKVLLYRTDNQRQDLTVDERHDVGKDEHDKPEGRSP